MTTGPVTFSWRGCRVSRSDSSFNCLPYEIWRNSTFALFSAERSEETGTEVMSHVVPVAEAGGAENFMPRLIDLRSAEQGSKGRLLERLDRRLAQRLHPGVEMFLETEASLDSVMPHLRARQLIQYRGMKGWLRLHDPWVWAHLPRILRVEQLRRLFGPIRRWSFFLDGWWWTAEMDGTQANHAAGGERADLTLDQWEALLRLGPVNRALFQRGWCDLAHLVEYGGHLDAHIQHARRRHGLERPTDLARYASLAAELRTDFDEHPLLRQVFKLAQHEAEEGTTLIDKLEAVAAEVWRDVAEHHARPRVNAVTGR